MLGSSEEELAKRIKKYILMVEKALGDAKGSFRGGDTEKYILELTELYLQDAKHYFSIKDYVTSLSCIAYAEGLLDALRILGKVTFKWEKVTPKKVLVGGTFDILHIGHIYYLREASKHGLVYAVIARDNNVKRIKGREPIIPEDQRLEIISSIKYVYKAVLGHELNIIKPIELIKPDVIVLGPDQPINEEWLSKELERKGLTTQIVRLPRRIGPSTASTTNIIREILRRYCPCK